MFHSSVLKRFIYFKSKDALFYKCIELIMFCSKAHLIYIKYNHLKERIYVCYFEIYFTTYFISFSVSLVLLVCCFVSKPHLTSGAFNCLRFLLAFYSFFLLVVFLGKIMIKDLYTIKFGLIPI